MPIYCTLIPSPEHISSDHPENPARFAQFKRRLALPLGQPLAWLKAQPATFDEAARVHTPQMLQFLQDACRQAPAIIDDAPTYVSKDSWQAALNAAGATLAVSRAVLDQPAGRGFALVRPPGHHAEPWQAKGFCLLNNIAIAALDALQRGAGRVAIVDFDAHHGNGTQSAVLKNEKVGFFSSHQENIYPYSGRMDEAPQARGRLINLPLPARAGDRAFEQIVTQVLRPWLERFKPSLMLISAGFDGHWSDPLTSLGISTRGYFRLAQSLLALADEFCHSRAVFVLEGGYDPQRLADNVAAVMYAMAGADAAPDVAGPSPYAEPDIDERLARLRVLHSL
jgi:acetoin utilization deacetylase AcuC-like enzyme